MSVDVLDHTSADHFKFWSIYSQCPTPRPVSALSKPWLCFSLKFIQTLMDLACILHWFISSLQFTEEKLGTAEKTELDAHFENLLQRAEKTKIWTEQIKRSTEALIQPNPSQLCVSVHLSVCLVCVRLTVTGGAGGGGHDQAWLWICRLYTYHYTVTTRIIPALRWAAMRAILMFQ